MRQLSHAEPIRKELSVKTTSASESKCIVICNWYIIDNTCNGYKRRQNNATNCCSIQSMQKNRSKTSNIHNGGITTQQAARHTTPITSILNELMTERASVIVQSRASQGRQQRVLTNAQSLLWQTRSPSSTTKGYLSHPGPCTPYLQQGYRSAAILTYAPVSPWAEAPNVATNPTTHQTLREREGACN